jgi:hypothetical protein
VAGQLNHNPAAKPVRDSQAWNDSRTVDGKLSPCNKGTRELGLGAGGPEGKRTCRHLKEILGDFRTGYKM